MTESKAAIQAGEPFAQFAGGRVLVAEDNPTNQIIVVTVLQRQGLTVDAVANGIEAVAAAASICYDVVLMDLQMPELDGLEATRHIRRLPEPHGRVAIIGLTANDFRQDHSLCLAAGMQAVVTKPIRWTDLAQIMAPYLPHADGTAPDGLRAADPSAWQKLVQDVGNGAARTITEVFLNDGQARLARIAEYLATANVKAIAREAHALKSSVELLGFERMTRIAARIQKLHQEADLAEVGGLADELAASFAVVEAICRERLAAQG